MGKYNLEKLIKIEIIPSNRFIIDSGSVETQNRCVITFERIEPLILTFDTLEIACVKQKEIERLFEQQTGRKLIEL